MKKVLIVATPDKIIRIGSSISSIVVGDTEYIFKLEGKREKIQAYIPDKYIALGELVGEYKEEVTRRAECRDLDIVTIK